MHKIANSSKASEVTGEKDSREGDFAASGQFVLSESELVAEPQRQTERERERGAPF